MTETKTTDRPGEQPPESKPKLMGLSATQLIGGALAAMTAAVVGARLGVAGTVLGAAVASVIAGVASTFYTASLRHTKGKITSVFVARTGDTRVQVTEVSQAPPTVPQATVSDDTVKIPSGDATGWSSDRPTAAYEPTTVDPRAGRAPASADPVARATQVGTGSGKTRLPWKPILLSAAAVFVLAIAGITGYELVSGHALSGGQGTTITQVSEGRTGPQTPAESTDTSTEPSAEPSTSTEPSATAEPSTDQSAEPSAPAEPSPSNESASEPSTDSNPTPASEASQPAGAGEPQADTGGAVGGTGG